MTMCPAERDFSFEKAQSAVVTPGARDLAVSLGQVGRYAGGARYRLDASQRELVRAVLERGYQLADPAFVYNVHEVTGFPESGTVRLGNGLALSVPEREGEAGTKFLACCVCTIGGRLEEAVRELMSAGDPLEGLFLDAAGVALLEALSTKAYDTLRKLAAERRLQAGCRFGPGYGELDLSLQRQLFSLVDASSIGVRLNDSCVMIPAKSLSFFTRWTTSQVPPGSRRKCASCTLTHCPYRV